MDLPKAIDQIKEIQKNLLKPWPNHSEETKEFKKRSIEAIDTILQELENKREEAIILTADEEEFLEVLRKVKNYPLDRNRDIELYQTLSQRYSTVDIIEAIKDWAIHKLEDPIKEGNNPRSQINTWARNCTKWNKNLKKDKPPVKAGKYSDIYL